MSTQGSDLFYFAFPLFIMILALAGYRRKFTGELILSLLLFFSMFRGDNVGNDTKTYMGEEYMAVKASIWIMKDDPETIIEGGIGRTLELSFAAMNWATLYYELPQRTTIWCLSMIQMLFLYLCFKRLKVNVALALSFYVLLGIYFFSLAAARQMAAVSVFVYGCTFIFENNSKKYSFLFYTLLATSIHVSSIFFIWLYLFRYINSRRKTVAVLITLSCAIMVFSSFNVMDVIFRVIDIPFVSDHNGIYNQTVRTSILSRASDLFKSFFLIYLFRSRKMRDVCDKYDLLFGVAVICWALFSHSDAMLSRITNFVIIFICVYEARALLENGLLSRKNFQPLFLLYLIANILGMRQWASGLTSGYYLSF